MFAYCGNNPVSFTDPTGHAYWGSNLELIREGNIGIGNAGIGSSTNWNIDLSELIETVVSCVGAAFVYEYSKSMRTAYENGEGGYFTNVHHIIPKGEYSGRSLEVQNNLEYARNMMENAGISVESSVWNLVVVSQKYHARLHSDEYLMRASCAIIDTDGSAYEIKWALVSLRVMIKFDDVEMYGF